MTWGGVRVETSCSAVMVVMLLDGSYLLESLGLLDDLV